MSQVNIDMASRLAAARNKLGSGTPAATQLALKDLNKMLRQDRTDKMGLRDMIPHILLQLGREQDCYDFIKWWANADLSTLCDASLPFLNIKGANAFEPLISLAPTLSNLTTSQLVALTLLKLRLYLDLSALSNIEDNFPFGLDTFASQYGPEIDRSLGEIVTSQKSYMSTYSVEVVEELVKHQYLLLCHKVYEQNPFFWDTLIANETPSPTTLYSPGSQEEADLIVHQSGNAWLESEDAICMIDADTASFARPYRGSTTTYNTDNSRSNAYGGRDKELQKRRGTGKSFPSVFQPPPQASLPVDLFALTPVCDGQAIRLVSVYDETQVLVWVDGACSNNGQQDPCAGWAVVYGMAGCDELGDEHVASGRLEDKGPFGDHSVPTSNRAELRAAIAALRLCDWQRQGFNSIVIATDSSYVVDGATGWAKKWVRNGWKLRDGGDVKNKDLWQMLLGEVERCESQDLLVHLWRIPREHNKTADFAAKDAVHMPPKAEFSDITSGMLAAPQAASEPRVLLLCLEEEQLFDAVFHPLNYRLSLNAKVERVTTSESALLKLSDSPPSIIVVADAAITRRRKIFERVADCLHEGATVILAGCFSGMVTEGEFNRLFAKFGLPWTRGSYHRGTVTLRSGVTDGHLTSRLPSSFSQKALFVKNNDKSTGWYTENQTSDEAAVAFAKLGEGRLGYVGDVNAEEASHQVVLAMCGFS